MYRERDFSSVFQIVKGTLISVAICFIGALLLAVLIRTFAWSDGVIRPVTTVLKAAAIFVGCLFSVREEKGLLKGVAVGAFSMMIACFLFCLIGGHFAKLFFLEVLFGLIIGALSGVIAVNVRRR